MKRTNSSEKRNRTRRGVDWKKTGLASLAASAAVSLLLALGTASKENKNYHGDSPYSHNLKEMVNGSKKVERGEPVPIFTGKVVVTHDGEPYEVKDSVKVYYNVDEHFTLDTEIIDGQGLEDLRSIIRSAATERDTSAVVGFDFAKDGVQPNTSPVSITINGIKGTASPEAIKYEGSSLAIGHVESENIRTAEERANICLEALKKLAEEENAKDPNLGIDISSIQLLGDEIQLSEEELDTLQNLAIFEGYPSAESMINANEKGEIKDASVRESINKIINNKRYALITYTKKGKPDTIYVIPIVLLPIIILKKKKSDSSDNSADGLDSGTTGGTTGESTAGGTETSQTEGGTSEGRGTSQTEGGTGGTSGSGGIIPPVYPPHITDTDNGGGETTDTGTGGGEDDGGGKGEVYPPLPIHRKRKQPVELVPYSKFPTSGTSHRPYTAAVQTKQPWDKREHYFRNERKGNFGRSRTGRTTKSK